MTTDEILDAIYRALERWDEAERPDRCRAHRVPEGRRAVKRLRRLLLPEPTPGPTVDPGSPASLALLLVLAVLALGAPVLEQLMWGPVQGCMIAFAGLGFGCGR